MDSQTSGHRCGQVTCTYTGDQPALLRWISCPSKPSILGIEGPQMSKSINPTSFPCAASANASCAENVLFPTPPFPDNTSTCGSPRQRDHPNHPSRRSQLIHPAQPPAHLVFHAAHALCNRHHVRIGALGCRGARSLRSHVRRPRSSGCCHGVTGTLLRSRRWGLLPDSGSLHMRRPCPRPPRLCLHPDTQGFFVNRGEPVRSAATEAALESPGQPALALSGVALIAGPLALEGR